MSAPSLPPTAVSPVESDIYRAGYQQVDPDYSSGVDLREDPSSYPPPPAPPASGSPSTKGPRPGEDFYPLGKAPERNEDALPSILANSNLAAAKPAKPTKKPSSFLDFLIPSFLSSRGTQADPEGPKKKAGPPVPNPPPASSIPQTLAKLPVPNRPPNTFPQPQELGGALNPIMIRVPGYGMSPPQHAFPKPPTLEDWNHHNQKILSNRSNQLTSHTFL